MKFVKLLILGVIAVSLMGAKGCKFQQGTISGQVTNKLCSESVGVEGVAVTLDPPVEDLAIVTDADGNYEASIPEGSYNLTFTKENYNESTGTAVVAKRKTTAVNAQLEPVEPVVVKIDPADQEGQFGGTVTISGSVEIYDCSTKSGIVWEQTGGPPATLTGATTEGLTVKLATYEQAKASLLTSLKQPDRYMVSGINPHSLAAGKTPTFKITVTTSSGDYSANAAVELPLALHETNGVPNVPINVPVLLHGATQDAYNWTVSGPGGSNPAVQDATTQDPSFTPDEQGEYTVTEENTNSELKVYAGTYAGGITGQDGNGNPVMGNCTTCHSSPATFSDKFAEWAASGHAHIFSDNVNTSDHYGESCLPCHTVGFNLNAANNGVDDQSDYTAFVDSGIMQTPDPNNWATVLSTYPKTASLTNIQCENCHGPNNSPVHLAGRENRNSISSNVCATCHGEPPRHGRFQQWEESGHSNYELILEGEGLSSSCARCHVGQGFLAYIQQDDLTKNLQGADGNATEEELIALGCGPDKGEPQTCVVCHDPHAVGTVSGDTTDAPVRISGDTPVLAAGFSATNVGKGAICIVCHNSRRGLRNDSNPPPSNSYSAPHESSQGDVLMGQNAFFVEVGKKYSHGKLKDSCVTCHMEATPPPPGFSYNQSGTNHSFEASITICSQCHTGLDGTALQGSTELLIEDLRIAIGTAASTTLNGLGTLKVRAYDPATELFSSDDAENSNVSINTAANKVTVTDAYYLSGQTSFKLTLATPIEITWTDGSKTTSSSFSVQMQSLRDGEDALVYDPATSNMFRACWNYILIIFDLSKGVHNPGFVGEVLNVTVTKDLSF